MDRHIKKIGIVCCSNGLKRSFEGRLSIFEETLQAMGIWPVFTGCIFEKDAYFSSSAKERAAALMALYADDAITDIFDISGGDLANGILPYLNYEVIARSNKCFWGYSDLTTVLNAIYTKTGKSSGLYQLRNILSEYKERQIAYVKDLLLDQGVHFSTEQAAASDQTEKERIGGIQRKNRYLQSEHAIFRIKYHFVQGNGMKGIVIGGNIRCFLKLAGTEYMPDFQNKILLLESRSGLIPQMETFLSQLQQLGAFDKISGILLGTFTQLESETKKYEMVELVQKYAGKDMPVAITEEIGHGTDSKAIMVGAYHEFVS